MHELGSLLGRWHQWRRHWSHERKFSRVALLAPTTDPDDELEDMTMRLIEDAVSLLRQDHQLAIQHIARAECMGVEVIINPRLGDRKTRQSLVAGATRELEQLLRSSGVL